MRCTVVQTLRWLLVVGIVVFIPHGAAAAIADFEDLALAPESYWNGSDGSAGFDSGGATFVNRYNFLWASWDGFAYSNSTNNTTPGWGNQYSALAGSGYGGSSNYGLAHGYSDTLDPTDVGQLETLPYFDLPDGNAIQGAYVTNTTYTGLSMLNGDAFAVKFGWRDTNQDGDYEDPADIKGDFPDWLLLTAYGTDASGTPLPGKVDFYLADYQFDNDGLDYLLDGWAHVDLSPLAAAERLYFNLTSSDVGSWGMNTPAYFAIDNIGFSDSEVPEPSTFAIFAGGALAVGAFSLFRRRRALRRSTRRSA